MNERGQQRALRRHKDELVRINEDMLAGRNHQALETMRRVLGDFGLPPETRVNISVLQARAQVRVGLLTEAMTTAIGVTNYIRRHNLGHLWPKVNSVLDEIEEAQADQVGGLGI